ASAWTCLGATSPRYENFGTVDTENPPQIDAVEFVNQGVFSVSTFHPYDTQNTLYYTNRGTMRGSAGFHFDYVNSLGLRSPAKSFYNRGEIVATEAFAGFGQLELLLQLGAVMGSYIDIDAENIVSSGVMRVGALGRMTLDGDDVRLERAGLVAGISVLSELGRPFTQFVGETDYIGPGGINEIYWGAGSNGRMDPQNTALIPTTLADVVRPSSGRHEVAYPAGFTNTVSIPNGGFIDIAGYTAFAMTNALTETNWVVQVIFTPTNYPAGMGVEARFAPPIGSRGNPVAFDGCLTALVRYSLPDIDAVTGLPFTNRVYISDAHAWVTNATLLTNALAPTLLRPNVIDFSFNEPPDWELGEAGNAVFSDELIAHPDSVSARVTNYYAAVSVGLGTVSRVITTPGGNGLFPNLQRFLTPENNAIFGGSEAGYLSDPTNNPARIEINADTLDLYHTRLKSDGMMSINARHFTGRSPARTDSPLFRFNVGSTNASVIVSNVVPTTVRRLTGVLSCWSGIWTNQIPIVVPDPNDAALSVTNTVDIRTHVFIVDTSGLGSIQPVETMDAEFHANHVQYHDNANITRRLSIDALSFHNLGQFQMLRPERITDADFPRLQILTNDGGFFARQGFSVGTDRTISNRVQMVVNNGTISASGVRIRAESVVNTGVLGAPESLLSLDGDAIKLDGGSLVAQRDVILRGKDAKAQGSFIQAGTAVTNDATGVVTWYSGFLEFNLTDRLADGGAETDPNEWVTFDGIQMLVKPALGDLLNTTIRSEGNIFGDMVHLWAGEDRGATAAGYQDNVAVGRLILNGRFQSLFSFEGTGAANALYVNYLQLDGTASDIEAALDLAPNFKIYFAESNLPAEDLHGRFDGRLVHVTGVTLPTPPPATIADAEEGVSSVPLRIGTTREGGNVRLSNLAWLDVPGGEYTVEYTTDLSSGKWSKLGDVSNGASRRVSFELPANVASGANTVFFRVIGRH
ncbi:MAG: hypothetical protein IT580_12675, partial [Verrucomicrobiales bacterium]|nr:hypothetical protein [Verrucomicrobiales bacterium]